MSATITAADLMTRDVVSIGTTETLREAMALMVENHVGGLPVLDSKDRVVGVVSATDILSQEYEQAEAAGHDTQEEEGAYYNPDSQRWENVRVYSAIDELPEMRVEEVMSDAVIFVHPDTSISEVAQAMVSQGIHHVLVIDDKRRLHGIISALDFVQIVAQQTS